MKQFLLVVLFTSSFAFIGYGQNINFTIKADSTIINGEKEYSITIEIISGNGPYSYYLCDKEPWFGGTIIEQYHGIQSSKYIFTKLTQCNNRVVLVKGVGKSEYNWKTVTTRTSK